MKIMDYNFNKNRMQPAKTSGQPGQVSSGPAKRSLAMEIPEYDHPTSEGVYKQFMPATSPLKKSAPRLSFPRRACPRESVERESSFPAVVLSPATIVCLPMGDWKQKMIKR
jgi:hypothetical protein